MSNFLSDSDLIKEINQNNPGREQAFREIFRRYSKKVYFYSRKFTGCSAIAEDITQDTFIKFLDFIASGRNIDNTVALLFRIAKNLCINKVKYESRFEELSENGSLIFKDKTNESAELAQMIESALELLPENQKDAICLQLYCGFTYDEIAVMNDVPVSTVRNWIVRAKTKLRKILTPYFEDSK